MTEQARVAAGSERRNRSTLIRLVVSAFLMFGFGYALVPFYEKLCQVLDVNNLNKQDNTLPLNTQVDRSRNVTVEFDANLHKLPWNFKPVTGSLVVHPGEVVTVEYEVSNTRENAVTGQAIPSYTPSAAMQYFQKLDCFCFKQQTLAAGETRRMPIAFLVSPDLPKDINTITLSYTFFEVPGATAATTQDGRTGG
ncbi:MAG: cytochrome c oxidase assembly protein [Methyloversatilis sp.]|jgi:cytochrome c oxidase assembly protein subunit 11|uniref:cytochrome c oxidase assembly protein n=1 Tax=Methyloversatilis TaxID=378210 RepID=UPI00037496B7|nr:MULTISPECIES: cytochrome c oxidase assembly protein [Methyloversatilis]MBV5287287.1 cytochrome c oxidase assembly protein [Methyloversatilis discipulorum]MCR6664999.1 cytochrome c oxidase assembly protein [Methyloversatilis sp.]